MPGFAGRFSVPYPHASNVQSPDVATYLALGVCIGLFALGLYLVIRGSRQVRSQWNDDQWRSWWDHPMLPSEPDPDGGLDLPKEMERPLVEAVAGSQRSGA